MLIKEDNLVIYKDDKALNNFIIPLSFDSQMQEENLCYQISEDKLQAFVYFLEEVPSQGYKALSIVHYENEGYTKGWSW